jgi:ATP-dependent helicase HepA
MVRARRGDFVRCASNDFGIGKGIRAEGARVEIEYFASIADDGRVSVVVPRTDVRRVTAVPNQTRCYVQTSQGWRVGRIEGKIEDRYVVKFPNNRIEAIDERDLHVRWDRPIDDPTHVVMAGGMESPHFHECRRPFVASILRQRGASRGLDGVLSAVAEFYPHQLEVVSRVLTDPVQRYLLADEVGLGKTIEALFIIRQHLLDSQEACVLVIAPRLLVGQWRAELTEKALIADLPAGLVRVLPHDAVEEWQDVKGATLVVADEAHHLAAGWGSKEGSLARRYQALEALVFRVISSLT